MSALPPAWRKPVSLAAAAACLAALPLVTRSPYHLTVAVFVCIYALVTIGLGLLMGYAGQISLGHAAFFGLGAYTSAILTTQHGVNPWAALLAGIILTSLVAWIVGFPTLRLHGHYLAMATLGLGIIFQIIFKEAKSLTLGTDGIRRIPPLALGGIELRSDLQFYYLIWPCLLVVIALATNIVNSRPGRALRAIHDSEPAAAAAGVNTSRYKLQIFVLSAALAALAGSLYAHYIRYISPDRFGFTFSIQLLVMVVAGGARSVWGAFLGAGLFTILREVIVKTGERIDVVSDLDVVLFGLILMIVVIFAPQGLASIPGRLRARRETRAGQALVR